MFKEINKKLDTSFSEIQSTYRLYQDTSAEQLLRNPTDHYRVDRNSAVRYFGIFPKWQNKMETYFDGLIKDNQKFSYVDICGRASGRCFGASTSYLFSFKAHEIDKVFSGSKDVFIDGDIFSPTDFSRLIQTIRSRNCPPAFITFMPMAGLHNYAYRNSEQQSSIRHYESITYLILAKRLKILISILRPGGYIMMERPFQFDGSAGDFIMKLPQNQFRIAHAVKKLVRILKCRVEIMSHIGGPYFLIHKPV